MGRHSAEARPHGAVWRRLHRWIGSVALAFLALIAVTGVTLQIEMMQAATPAAAPPIGAPAGAYTDDQVLEMVRVTLASAHRADPLSPLMELSLQLGPRPVGTVALRAATPQRYGFDARTGAVAGGGGGGARGFHLLLLRLHRGDIVGMAGLWISIVCGLALLTLCVSGALVYLELWRRRAGRGDRAVFWK